MSDTLKSPFKCGGVVTAFPTKIISGSLVIRVDNAALTDRIHIKIGLNGGAPAADNADMYLMGGDSIEICGGSVQNANQIQILNTVGDPNIYWYLENI